MSKLIGPELQGLQVSHFRTLSDTSNLGGPILEYELFGSLGHAKLTAHSDSMKINFVSKFWHLGGAANLWACLLKKPPKL